jgi:hypothetical protein
MTKRYSRRHIFVYATNPTVDTDAMCIGVVRIEDNVNSRVTLYDLDRRLANKIAERLIGMGWHITVESAINTVDRANSVPVIVPPISRKSGDMHRTVYTPTTVHYLVIVSDTTGRDIGVVVVDTYSHNANYHGCLMQRRKSREVAYEYNYIPVGAFYAPRNDGTSARVVDHNTDYIGDAYRELPLIHVMRRGSRRRSELHYYISIVMRNDALQLPYMMPVCVMLIQGRCYASYQLLRRHTATWFAWYCRVAGVDAAKYRLRYDVWEDRDKTPGV